MPVRVAINGFGRIGRLTLRAAYEAKRRDIVFVAINDLGSVEANAHLLRHDSVHDAFPGKVATGKDWISLDKWPGGQKINVMSERDPAKLPWARMKVDVVIESTGIFTSKEAASKHLDAGARRVLVSAPASGADITVVYGINDNKLRPELSATFSSAAKGWRKPKPDGFHLIARRWQLPAEAIVVVGDTLNADILGAENAGMKSILVTMHEALSNRDHAHIKPTAVAGSLSALPEIIARL